jgi:hypothetical protein
MASRRTTATITVQPAITRQTTVRTGATRSASRRRQPATVVVRPTLPDMSIVVWPQATPDRQRRASINDDDAPLRTVLNALRQDELALKDNVVNARQALRANRQRQRAIEEQLRDAKHSLAPPTTREIARANPLLASQIDNLRRGQRLLVARYVFFSETGKILVKGNDRREFLRNMRTYTARANDMRRRTVRVDSRGRVVAGGGTASDKTVCAQVKCPVVFDGDTECWKCVEESITASGGN